MEIRVVVDSEVHNHRKVCLTVVTRSRTYADSWLDLDGFVDVLASGSSHSLTCGVNAVGDDFDEAIMCAAST